MSLVHRTMWLIVEREVVYLSAYFWVRRDKTSYGQVLIVGSVCVGGRFLLRRRYTGVS
jgi:hypothetical protein